jgi:hypothetical protein
VTTTPAVHEGVDERTRARQHSTPEPDVAEPESGAETMLTLQEAAGNAAVTRLIRSSGAPGRPDEDEGRPLDPDVLEAMERRFGQRFEDVRVHEGREAAASADQVSADAFTVGSHVVFAAGLYQPRTRRGRHVLAHELTHVMQQRHAPTPPPGAELTVSSPSESVETEAEDVARSLDSEELAPLAPTLGGAPASIMRQAAAAPPAPPTTPVAGGGKVTFKTAKLEVPLDIDLGPVKCTGAGASGELTFDAPATPESSSGVSAKGGTVSSPSGAGLQGEVQKEWEKRTTGVLAGYKPQLKAGGEITTAGGELGIEGILEGDVVSGGLKFTIVSYEREKSQVQFATLTYTIGVPVKKWQMTATDGQVVNVEAKVNFEFNFQPNWARIGTWLSETFTEVVVTDLTIMGGIIAAGALTIAIPLLSMGEGEMTAGIVDKAAFATRDYATGYVGGLTGEYGGGGSDQTWAGYVAGRAKQEELGKKAPPDIVREEARAHRGQLDDQARKEIKPKFRQQAISEYWERHTFEKWVYGEEGGHGFAEFLRVLEAAGM